MINRLLYGFMMNKLSKTDASLILFLSTRLSRLIFLFIPLFSFGQDASIDSIIHTKIISASENPVHSILFYYEQTDGNFIYNKGFGNLDQDTRPASNDSRYRIASTTKLFVSTLILQLVEEGKLNLNDRASRYLDDIECLHFDNLHVMNNKKLTGNITIEQLLSHRTGLADIFTDKGQVFFNHLMSNPNRQYSPQSIVDLYYQFHLNTSPHFEPGNGWCYSDMNYVLAGLIIEEIEEIPLAKSIRNRILEPLNMKNTYFEFYEKPLSGNNLVHQYVGNIDFTKINTSFDWAGGGLVSTNQDMATFLKALFNLKMINKHSLNKMIDVKFTRKNENRYGLGIYESEYNGDRFYGHYGFYGTYAGYCPDKKIVISYSVSQSTPDFNVNDFINEIIEQTE